MKENALIIPTYDLHPLFDSDQVDEWTHDNSHVFINLQKHSTA